MDDATKAAVRSLTKKISSINAAINRKKKRTGALYREIAGLETRRYAALQSRDRLKRQSNPSLPATTETTT